MYFIRYTVPDHLDGWVLRGYKAMLIIRLLYFVYTKPRCLNESKSQSMHNDNDDDDDDDVVE